MKRNLKSGSYMKPTIQNNDREFLEQILKFYRNIDKYSALLEIEPGELAAFKNDVSIFVVIASKRYHSFNDGFIRYNINMLRNRLERLFSACSNHQNYNRKIGLELDIVLPWYFGLLPLSWPSPGISFNQATPYLAE